MAIGSNDSEKKIKFTAEGNLTPFMQKLQADAKKLYAGIADESKKQFSSAKDQNKFIQERLRLLKEELKVKQDISREDVKRLKGNYDRSLASSGADSFSTRLWKEKLEEAQAKHRALRDDQRTAQHASIYREEEKKKDLTGSVFSGALLAGLVRDLWSEFRKTANAGTGLDLVSPMMGLSGAGAGAVAGSLVEAATAGQIEYAIIGAQMGKEIGGYVGDAVTRSFRLRSEYDTAAFGYRGLTGKNANVPGMSSMAYDDIAVAQAMQRIAAARGGTGDGVRGILGLQRGYSISEGALLGGVGLERMGTGGLSSMQRSLGIAIAEGLNRSRLTDVITTQTALLQEFSKTATSASATEANRALFEFNRIGGQFGIGDPRALANINAIQEGLSNPNSAFGQAQNYAVLRRLNPGSSVWQLRKMQQQGLQTPGFLSAIINDIAGGGGSEDFQKFQLMNRFPGLSMDAIDTIYNNKSKIGSMSPSDFNKMLTASEIEREGEANTSKLMRYTAEVSNAFRDNFIEGIKTVSRQFETEMKQAVTEIADLLRKEFGIGGTEDSTSYKSVREAYVPKKNGKLGEAEIKPLPLQPMGGKSISNAQIKSLRGQ